MREKAEEIKVGEKQERNKQVELQKYHSTVSHSLKTTVTQGNQHSLFMLTPKTL